MPRAARLLPLIAVTFVAACALPRHHAKPVPEGAILFDSAQASGALTCAGAFLAAHGYLVQNNSTRPHAERSIRGTREMTGGRGGYTADIISVYLVSIAETSNMRLVSVAESREYEDRGNLTPYTLRSQPKPEVIRDGTEVRTLCSEPQ